MKKCTHCTYENDDMALFCIKCGKELPTNFQLEEDLQAYLSKSVKRMEYGTSEETYEETTVTSKVELQRCFYCGAYNTSDMKSCCNCGALLQKVENKSAEKKNTEVIEKKKTPSFRSKKIRLSGVNIQSILKNTSSSFFRGNKYGIFALIILLLIVCTVAITKLVGQEYGISAYTEDAMDYVWEEDGITFITNQKLVAQLNDDVEEVVFTLDRTKAMVLTKIYDQRIGGDLYLIDSKGDIQLLDYGVVGATLSDSGNGIAYYKDYNESTKTANLYYHKGKEPVMIEEVSISITDFNLAISPDGKIVGYYSNEYGDEMGYLSTNGKKGVQFGENRSVVAIADDGDYIYYVKTDQEGISKLDNLYVKHHKVETKLYGTEDFVFGIHFNQDYSEVLITQTNQTYLSIQGRDKEKLGNDSLVVITPRLTQLKKVDDLITYGIRNFEEMAYQGEESIYYLEKDYYLKKLANHSVSAKISGDLKTLIYTDSEGDLFTINKMRATNPSRKKIMISGETWDFVISDEGKLIYYLNKDGELYLVKNSGDTVKLSNEASPYLQISGDVVYFLYDYDNSGMLCYIEKEKRVTVSGGDEIQYMFSLGNGIIYSQGDYNSSDFYGISQSKKKVKLIQDVNTYQ